jgi:hypothetical protein
VAEIRIRTPEITDPALIEKLKLIDHEINHR